MQSIARQLSTTFIRKSGKFIHLSVEIEVAYGSDLEQTCYTVLPARFAYFRADSPDGDTDTMASVDCRKVVVSKLPSDMFTAEDVTVFFESRRFCPVGGDVSHVEMNAKDHSAVVTFVDWSGRRYTSSIVAIRNTCSHVRHSPTKGLGFSREMV